MTEQRTRVNKQVTELLDQQGVDFLMHLLRRVEGRVSWMIACDSPFFRVFHQFWKPFFPRLPTPEKLNLPSERLLSVAGLFAMMINWQMARELHINLLQNENI